MKYKIALKRTDEGYRRFGSSNASPDSSSA